MREIKFRAWDKEKKQMVYVLEMKFIFESAAGIWVMGYDNDKIDHEIFPENFELMEYTGLKDKNSKEIYEGDVVRTFYSWMYDAIGIVEFILIDSAFRIVFKKAKESVIRTNQCKIIGNIYENPELLKE